MERSDPPRTGTRFTFVAGVEYKEIKVRYDCEPCETENDQLYFIIDQKEQSSRAQCPFWNEQMC